MTAAPNLRARLADAVHRTLADSRYWLPADGQARVVDAVHAVVTAPGYCPHCGPDDCAPTAAEYEEMRQRAETAEAALAAFHEGEAEPRDGMAEPTPAEWLWRWNRATAAQRLEAAAESIENGTYRYRCVLENHQSQAPRRRAAEAALGRVRDELDRWMRNTLEPQTMRALSDVLAAFKEPRP